MTLQADPISLRYFVSLLLNLFGIRFSAFGIRILFPLSAFCFQLSSFGLSVRVDPAGGAPRLVVNGEPVRARMFWGAEGSSLIALQPAWQRIEFEFVASADADKGTMHFRFGAQPGEVCLDDIQATDLNEKRVLFPKSDFESGPESFTRDWQIWPPGNQNTVGVVSVTAGAGHDNSAGLRIQLKAPPKGKWPQAKPWGPA